MFVQICYHPGGAPAPTAQMPVAHWRNGSSLDSEPATVHSRPGDSRDPAWRSISRPYARSSAHAGWLRITPGVVRSDQSPFSNMGTEKRRAWTETRLGYPIRVSHRPTAPRAQRSFVENRHDILPRIEGAEPGVVVKTNEMEELAKLVSGGDHPKQPRRRRDLESGEEYPEAGRVHERTT